MFYIQKSNIYLTINNLILCNINTNTSMYITKKYNIKINKIKLNYNLQKFSDLNCNEADCFS